MKKIFAIIFILTLAVLTKESIAQELVYSPINPSFAGGNSFNASWLLSSAQAQNTITESRDYNSYERDPLKDFEDNIKRQILYEISRNLTDKAFGEDGLQEGHYEWGNFIIDVVPGADGLTITILDIANGGETSVIVPNL